MTQGLLRKAQAAMPTKTALLAQARFEALLQGARLEQRRSALQMAIQRHILDKLHVSVDDLEALVRALGKEPPELQALAAMQLIARSHLNLPGSFHAGSAAAEWADRAPARGTGAARPKQAARGEAREIHQRQATSAPERASQLGSANQASTSGQEAIIDAEGCAAPETQPA
ncbi:hypothetical protein WJX72_005580 [[Myrmecia] bisecta]|uniref:Uncharacterized protein n=1 Tax=[Myrmecia] bisecta TaxID=41462 RepID=A0AAW1Q593_9CHLO